MSKSIVESVAAFTTRYKNESGSDKVSGQMMGHTNMVVILAQDIKNGEEGAAFWFGRHKYTKLSGEAWTKGAKIYFDSGNNRLTTTSTSNTLAGLAAQTQASSDVVGEILLNLVLV